MTRVAWMFTKREGLRFWRQKGRLVATLVTPLLFWLMIGHGFGSLFEQTFLRTDALTYFFPGILVMTVLFSSVFSMISLIEDRNEGFLQGVRLVPGSARKIVLGKVSASSVVAILQTILVVLLAPLIEVRISVSMLFQVLLIVGLTSVFLSLVGFVFAWWLNSVQGFHAVMNVVLLPMWMLSGAVFPYASASVWMHYLMKINPLRLVVSALHEVLYVPVSMGSFVTANSIKQLLLILTLLIVGLGVLSVRQVHGDGVTSSK